MNVIVAMVAKEPVPAQVKTRLCPQLSAAEAAELYALFIQDMVEEMARLMPGPHPGTPGSAVALAYTPEGSDAAFKALLPVTVPLFPQQGRDLGERLAGIFRNLCDQGYEQVHIINSDSPDLPCDLIRESIRRLEEPRTDLVLGPCRDGGYYLVGLKRPVPELFARIPWSTERVLEMTLERARRLGLSFALLEPWDDIDTYEDLLHFLARNRHRPDNGSAPGWRTLRYLRQKIHGNLWMNAFNGMGGQLQ
jgi:rSAM/selenodomain-associated transferase 1